MNISKIYDNSSYAIVLSKLRGLFRDRWLTYYDYNIELDEIIFKNDSGFLELKASDFIDSHKELVYSFGNLVQKDMGNFVRAQGKFYSPEEFKKKLDARKEINRMIRTARIN